jgi:hypothetical protein
LEDSERNQIMFEKLRLTLCTAALLLAQVQTAQAASCPGGSAYYAPRSTAASDRNDGSALYPVRTKQRAKEILSAGGRLYLMDQGKVYFVQCVEWSDNNDVPTG